MTLPYKIREASLDDNERLIELARRCPVKGQLQVYSDRYPDFFALLRLQGERSHIYVAEALNGDIVASAAFIERTEVIDDKEVKVLHFGDLRTDPKVRQSRIAGKLIAIYRQLLLTGRYHHGVAEMLQGNHAPIKAQRLLGQDIEVRHEGEADMYQLLPIWNYRASKAWTYRTARPEDVPQLADLLNDSYRDVRGAPHFSKEWLENVTQQHASFNLSQIWLAEDARGEICACVGLWDQSAFRRTIAVRFSGLIKFLVRFFAALGLLWRLPPLPREGRPLRYAYLRWPAARPQQAKALASLLRYVMRRVREENKHQFIAIAFHKQDRLRRAIRGIARVKEQVHLFSHTPKAENASLPALQKTPRAHYIDMALV